ncbi:MAG TPA: cadherin domain-containing protein [Allosphingosinicella sp.]|jgi:Ca2+-binding RTX toxin-like protein
MSDPIEAGILKIQKTLRLFSSGGNMLLLLNRIQHDLIDAGAFVKVSGGLGASIEGSAIESVSAGVSLRLTNDEFNANGSIDIFGIEFAGGVSYSDLTGLKLDADQAHTFTVDGLRISIGDKEYVNGRLVRARIAISIVLPVEIGGSSGVSASAGVGPTMVFDIYNREAVLDDLFGPKLTNYFAGLTASNPLFAIRDEASEIVESLKPASAEEFVTQFGYEVARRLYARTGSAQGSFKLPASEIIDPLLASSQFGQTVSTFTGDIKVDYTRAADGSFTLSRTQAQHLLPEYRKAGQSVDPLVISNWTVQIDAQGHANTQLVYSFQRDETQGTNGSASPSIDPLLARPLARTVQTLYFDEQLGRWRYGPIVARNYTGSDEGELIVNFLVGSAPPPPGSKVMIVVDSDRVAHRQIVSEDASGNGTITLTRGPSTTGSSVNGTSVVGGETITITYHRRASDGQLENVVRRTTGPDGVTHEQPVNPGDGEYQLLTQALAVPPAPRLTPGEQDLGDNVHQSGRPDYYLVQTKDGLAFVSSKDAPGSGRVLQKLETVDGKVVSKSVVFVEDKNSPTGDREADLSQDIILVDSAGYPVLTKNRRFIDIGDRHGTGSYTVKTYTDGPMKGITRISLGNSPLGIGFDTAGAVLGNILGKTIAGDNKVAGIVASAALKSVGQTLGGVLNGKLGGASNEDIKKVLGSFDEELLRNLKLKGVGALSSYLVSQLVEAVGVDGFVGELANTALSEALRSEIANLLNLQTNNIVANVGNAVGSLVGAKLASEIATFHTIGGQLGATIGTTVGSLIATSTSLIFTAGTSASSAAVLGLELGVFAGPVAAAIGAFVGYLLGGVIGSLFGGTPRSGSDVQWDADSNKFIVSNIYSKKGGSRDAAVSMADAVASTFNNVLAATGGTLLDPQSVQAGNYGMRMTDLVYRPLSTRDKTAIVFRQKANDPKAMANMIGYGVYEGLADPDFRLAGGDVYVKRALYNTVHADGVTAETFDPADLVGNMMLAEKYERYLANAAGINALVAAQPDSVFATEVAITLAAAADLGLTKRHASDWYGGFTQLLGEAGEVAANVHFGFDYDWDSQQLSRLISVGGQFVRDTVDIGGQTTIEGGDAGETIRLTHSDQTADGRRISGGADILASTSGLLINGVQGDGSALSVEIAATIDAGGGDDFVYGGDLGNTVIGGAGDDHLYGGKLDDWLLGAEGNDELYAGDELGNAGGDGNYLDGGDGNDQVFGREGSDWLEGGEGDDLLDGGDGDDVLAGGGGTNILKGGRGDDQYLVRFEGGNDEIDESATVTVVHDTVTTGAINWLGDEADLALAGRLNRFALDHNQIVAVSIAAVAADGNDAIVFGGGIQMGDLAIRRSGTDTAPGNDLIIKVTQGTSESLVTVKDWFTDPLKRVEWLKFADGNEIRIGDTTNFIVGTPGDDYIIGTEFNDFVVAGDGNDEVHLLGGDDFGSGGRGDDLLFGDGENDIVVGGLGRDTLYGGDGSDMLSGDAGNDELDGGTGDDVLSGGRGDDRLKGGVGNDTFRIARGDGRDTILEEEVLATPDETAWVAMTDSQGRLLGGYTYDSETGEIVDADGTLLREDYAYGGGRSLTWRVPLRYQSGILYRYTGQTTASAAAAGADKIDFAVGINVQDLIFDTSGPDLVIGIARENDGTATAADAAGSITIRNWNGTGAPANRPIGRMTFYQAGDVDVSTTGKVLKGFGAGDDSFEGGDGQEWVTGGGGNDDLSGNGGDDILSGNAGDDTLSGGAGSDVLYGGAGQDTLTGGVGDDVLSGGDADDILEGGIGADVLAGGSGVDTASYAHSMAAVVVSLAGSSASSGGDAAGDRYVDIENLTGSDHDDRLAGDESDNVIEGGKGADLLRGLGGADTYVWNLGDGSDVIADGIEEVIAADGTLNPLYTETSTDSSEWVDDPNDEGISQPTIIGNGDPDAGGWWEYHWSRRITGPAGELVYSDEGVTTDYSAVPGSERRSTGWQNGFAATGSGGQVARGAAGDAADPDVLELGEGISLSDLGFAWIGNDLRITVGGAGGPTITIRNQGGADGAGSRIEALQFYDGQAISLANIAIGGNGADGGGLVAGGSGADVLHGGSGNDALWGGGGGDTLYGGAGDDVFESSADADSFDGEAGANDVVRYVRSTAGVTVDLNLAGPQQSAGSAAGDALSGVENVTGSDFGDVLTGNEAGNRLLGRGGDNVLYGRGGDDVLIGDAGSDTLDGGDGADNISAGAGALDRAFGGAGNDFIDGGEGVDILQGGAGEDQLLGGEGNDDLYGDGAELLQSGDVTALAGGAKDSLQGGGGSDRLWGGEGDDLLDGGTGDDSLRGGAGADQYYFEPGSGADTIVDDSGANSILFGQGVTFDRLWFSDLGNGDLRIGVIGSGGDSILVRGFFTGAPTIHSVIAGGYALYLDNPDTLDLVHAMGGGTPAEMSNTVAASLESYWHEGGKAAPTVEQSSWTLSGTEDQPVSGGGNYGVIDHDSQAQLVYALAADGAPAHGTVSVDPANGAVIYTPNANFNGNDTFVVLATDPDGQSVALPFAVTIAGANDAPATPVLTAGGGTTAEGSAGWSATFSTSDPDGSTPTLRLVANPQGLFAVSGDTVGFVSTPDFEALVAMGFAVTDGDGDGLGEIALSGSVDATDGELSTPAVAFSAVVEDVNEAPTALSLAGKADSIVERDRLAAGSARPAVTLGTVAVSDADLASQATGRHNFKVFENGSAAESQRFAVVGGQLVLLADKSVDFETDGASIALTVRATDQSAAPISYDQTFTFAIADQIDVTDGDAGDNNPLAGQSGQDLVRGFAGNDVLLGSAGDDRLEGGDGNDVLEGGAGADILDGGAGTDVARYAGSPGAVTADLAAGTVGGGDATGDTLVGIEGIEGSAFADTLLGSAAADVLRGGAGDDYIDGRAGADQMAGGAGDDVFVVDNAGDLVTELAGEGTDEVRTSLADYTLAGGVEKLTATSTTAAQTLRDNGLDNVITGTTRGDIIYLRGGGSDTASGGAGADGFFVGSTLDPTDRIDGGADSDYLVVQGNTNQVLTAQVLTSVESLYPISGSDPSYGDSGLNRYSYSFTTVDAFVAAGQKFTLDAYSLIAGENLTFDGSAETDGYFWMFGGGGIDMLTGGAGADSFIFDPGHFNAGDRVVGGSGIDALQLQGSFTIGFAPDAFTGIEKLVAAAGRSTPFIYDLTTSDANVATGQTLVVDGSGLRSIDTLTFNGSAETDGAFAITGGAANDSLTGGAGADTLTGGAGNDLLDGRGGADSMSGGIGDDIYLVDSLADTVAELGNEGNDEVRTSLADYTAAANVEKLTGTSTTAGQTLRDNALNNTITGTGFADSLYLKGGGEDSASGGAGDDYFVMGASLSAGDTLDGGAGFDWLLLQGNYATTLTAAQTSGMEIVSLYSGATTYWGDTANNIYSYDLATADAAVAAGSYLYIYAADLHAGENLTFNGAADTDGHLVVYGGGGRDLITGGAGNDSFFFLGGKYDAALDKVAGGANWDNIGFMDGITTTFAADAMSSIEGFFVYAGTGAANANYSFTMNNGNVAAGQQLSVDATALRASESLVLDGSAETDGTFYMQGGAGNDTLTGGALGDTLVGGAGDDLLSGGAGADAMTGGSGNDIYVVDNAGDTVTEAAGGGTDEVRTNLGIYTLAANVEKATYTGTGTASFNLTANALDNTITGGAGNDYFYLQDGGNDTVYGGAGNDFFYMRGALSAGDVFDGGAGTSDQLGLQGNYTVTLGAQQLTNVEFIDILSGTNTRWGDAGTSHYAYNVTSIDANVPAGSTLTVDAWELVAGESLTFNGSAETNGSFFFYGGMGTDNLTGGAGGDTFEFDDNRWQAGDKVAGGVGTDILKLYGNYTVTFAADAMTSIEKLVVAANRTYNLTTNDANVAAGKTLIVDATALAAANSLTFNGAAETDGAFNVTGGAGNDVITGGAGQDTLSGGAGNDSLYGNGESDMLYGGAGDDLLDAGDAGDDLDGGTGNDILIGGAGDDRYLIGRHQGDDRIRNYDPSPTAFDQLSLGDDIAYKDIWFERVDATGALSATGANLRLAILGANGTDGTVTVEDWFTGTNATVFKIDLITDTTTRATVAVDVDALTAEMAKYQRPASSAAMQSLMSGSSTFNAAVEGSWKHLAPPVLAAVANVSGVEPLDNETRQVSVAVKAYYSDTTGLGIVIPATSIDVVPVADAGFVLADYVSSWTAGTPDSAGNRTVTLTLTQNGSTHLLAGGVLPLHMTAKIKGVYDGQGTLTSSQPFTLAVAPTADTPTLSASSPGGNAGTLIPLTISAVSPDTDGSEKVDVLIGNLPAGYSLVNAQGNAVGTADPYKPAATGMPIVNNAKTTVTDVGNGTFQIVKTGTNQFDASAVSSTPIAGDFVLRVKSIVNDTYGVAAMNSDPLTDAGYAGLDYLVAFTGGGQATVGENGGQALNFTANGQLWMWRTGTTLKYGTGPDFATASTTGLLRTVTNVTAPLYFDSSFGANNNTIEVQLTPGFTRLRQVDLVGLKLLAPAGRSDDAQLWVTPESIDGPSVRDGAYGVLNVKVNAPPSGATLNGSINENAANGALVGNVVGTDPDPGDTLTYTLLDNAGGRFALSGAGVLTVANGALLNYEAATSHNIVVRVTDQGALYADRTLAVAVNNVNEANSLPASYSMSVNENVAIGTPVGTVAATDPDSAAVPFGQQAYYFVYADNSVHPTSADGRYAISSATGAITTAMALDYETMTAAVGYSVVARDNNGNTPYNQAPTTVTIGVLNVNETPGAPALQSQTLWSETLAGDTPHNNQVIATFGLTDPDGTVPALQIVGGNPYNWFAISGNKLTFGAANFTADWLRSYMGQYGTDSAWNYDTDGDGLKEVRVGTVTLAAVDSGGLQSSPITYNILIEDKNEAPVFTTTSFTPPENLGYYAYIGTVAASDPDGAASDLRYAFTGGTLYSEPNMFNWVTGSADGRFIMDVNNGNVFVNGTKPLDYEGLRSFSYSIYTSDKQGGQNSKSTTGTLGINLTNVNEKPNPLTLQSQTLWSETLPTDTPHYNQTIATFGLSDPDGAVPALQIVGGNTYNWFTISGNNLTFAGSNFSTDWLRSTLGQYGQDSAWNYDTDGDGLKEVRVATLTLAAVDSNGVQSDPFTYNVLIEDKNEAPVWGANPYSFALTENAGAYVQVGTVAASDPDGSAGALRYAFTGSNAYTDGALGRSVTASPDGRFIVDYLDGRVWVNGSQSLNYEATPSFSYGILTADRPGDPNSKVVAGTLNVSLQNVNDNAPAQPGVQVWGTTAFNENSGAGVTVATLTPVSDADGALTPVAYELTANPGGLFEVVGQTVRMRDGVTPDYEAFASGGGSVVLQLQVRANDGTYVSPSGAISVTINNVNDNATWFYRETTPFTVTENTPYGTVVSDGPRATDSDGFAISYSIDQTTNPNGAFGINAAGQITIANGVDYEAGGWLSDASGKYANLRVLASDGGAAAATTVQIRIANEVLTVSTANSGLTSRYRQEITSTPDDVMIGGGGEYDPWGGPTYGQHSWYTEVKWIDNQTGAVVMTDGDTGPYENTTNRPLPDKNYAVLADGFHWTGNGWEMVSDDEFNGNTLYPIVIDLLGQGIDHAFGTATAAFDIAGNGTKANLQWLNAGFGFLALDRNGDGRIGSGLEISFAQDKPGAATDLEGLVAYDTNGDMKLSAADARFADFRVWQDLDGDGTSQAGELKSLAQLGIVSIDLKPTATGHTVSNTQGNVIVNTSSVAFADGTQRALGDAVLKIADAASAPAAEPAGPALETRSFEFKSGRYALTAQGGSLFVAAIKPRGTIDSRAQEVLPGALLSFRDRTVGLLDPIVLDLDGDGVELRGRTKAKARFDMDGNGSRDDTGWISKQDGFLVVDADGDGRIATAAELSLLSLKADAKSSLEALATLDADKNGVLDAKDSRFGELRLWVDANGNGITDAGELQSLADRGIASIGLAARGVDATVKLGANTMVATSTFTRTDGSVGTAGEAALAFRPAAAGHGAAGIQSGTTGEPEFGPSDRLMFENAQEVLSARLEALRSGLGSRPFASVLSASPAAFDRLQAAQESLAGPQESTLGTEDLPRHALPVDEDLGAAVAASPALDGRLAQMIQDMASFGLRSGEGEWKERGHADHRYDFFA